ncbi:MAG TPA: Na+/galactose cotransporter, partial [Edaphobacter sp.]|nr:Na+/galactose cotransporter [Edaphobacter sp.]
STVVGMLISVGTAYLVAHASSIMDYVQALFSFFIAPLFGTVVLGMLWKRATRSGGFWGLLSGTVASIGMWIWVQRDGTALRYIALSRDAQPMAENLYRALWSFLICVVVTCVVSMLTRPTPIAQLSGLVYGATEIPDDGATAVWQKPIFWASIVIVVFFILNLIFW